MMFSKDHSRNTVPATHCRQMHSPAMAGLIVLVVLVVHIARPLQAAPWLAPSAGSHNIEFKRYCSSSLADVMFSICGGKFYPLIVADNDSSTPESEGGLSSYTSSHESGYGPVQKEYIHECCRRPCGYSELKQYCSTAD